MIDLNNIKKIFFIGIGGIGMSAVAGLVKERGFQVAGSDPKEIYPPAKTILEKLDIPVNTKNPDDADLVVLGGAEGQKNSDYRKATQKNIPVVSYPELLYQLTRDKHRIVVTGTHGKTTTSALIAKTIKDCCSQDPGFFIGGMVRDLSTSFHYSAGRYFVIEGDEYYSSDLDKKVKFLHYKPQTLIITNIEMDHYDFYRNIGEVVDKFQKLIAKIPPDGNIIACADDLNTRKLLRDSDRNISWYGITNRLSRFQAKKIRHRDKKTTFQMVDNLDSQTEDITLNILGNHNILNTLACLATIKALRLSYRAGCQSLAGFKGPARRFEIIARKKGIIIIDDYAHHATAVKTTLKTARQQYPDSRIWAIFEPHTFSRTKGTLPDLGKSFSDADFIIIPDIYPAREPHLKNIIHAKDVVIEIEKNGQKADYIPRESEIIGRVLGEAKSGDVIIVMAVGSFNQIARKIAAKL